VAPATGTALILLVAFVLPGFVTVLAQERTFKSDVDATPFDRLLRAVYYSVWCYLLLAALALVLGLAFELDRAGTQAFVDRHDGNPAGLVLLSALLILGSATIVWYSTLRLHTSSAKAKMLRRLKINERHQQPTGWDFWFEKGFETHVRIVYPDGPMIWGYYGADSFASYAKDGLNLYLEAIYRERLIQEDDASDDLPGPWFGESHPQSRGGWVKVDDAVLVELYDFSDGDESRAAAVTDAGATGSEEAPGSAKPSAPTASSP
jgi:hypothetical protein